MHIISIIASFLPWRRETDSKFASCVYPGTIFRGFSLLSDSMAGWQSGYAAACKAVDAGSIPTPASISFYSVFARVVELVDTRDLKSLGGNSVPVRVRPRAPVISES
jgi:hypothetical protein